MSDRPTLGRVAQHAGVSLKTASRALNDEYGVAPATAARVRESAKVLGFRPNHLARALAAGGPSAAVGLVIPNVSDPFIAAVVGAVEAVVAPRGLHLMTASHNDDADVQRRIVRGLVERRVDALIVIPAPGEDHYLLQEIDHGLVVISLDRPMRSPAVDTVLVDNVAGATAAMQCLVELGHRRIGGLGNDARLWTLEQRHLGYRHGLAAAGLDYDPAIVHFDCRDDAEAERFVRAALARPDPPTAFFSAQHVPSRGLVRAMQRTGVVLDVVMFDEVVDTDLLSVRPRLVVASGPHRLGHIGAALAMEQLDADPATTRRPRSVLLPPIVIAADDVYRAPTPAESAAELAAVTSPARSAEANAAGVAR